MKKVIKTLDHIFDILFLTYPKPYREEYGLEIQGVFRQIIHAAAQKNTLQLARATFRELRDYPITLFREYRQNYLQKELAIGHEHALVVREWLSALRFDKRCGCQVLPQLRAGIHPVQ